MGGVSDVVGDAIYRLGVALYVCTSVIPQKKILGSSVFLMVIFNAYMYVHVHMYSDTFIGLKP